MLEPQIESNMQQGAARERIGSTLKRLSRTGALPTLPAVASSALALVRDPEADIEELCKIIQTDVGLSARVLRIANSAALGRRRPARKLSDAIVTVGLRKTCDVLVAACARQLYDAASPRAESLWNHALATAVASEAIARHTRLADPGRAFLPGLFHDVGRIAFLLADEVSLDVIDQLVQAEEGGRVALESEWYGFDHAEAGAILSEDWGLALEQGDAIRWHHDAENAGAARGLAMNLSAADRVAYLLGCGACDNPPSEAVSLEALGLEPDDAEALLGRIEKSIEDHREFLS